MIESARRLALVVSCLVVALSTTACRDQVLHDLPEEQAAHILAVLQQHGIDATKRLDDSDENRWAVAVPGRARARAFSILNEYKLPRADERRFRDVFGQSKLVMTPMEEQALFLEALQGELAHTLETIDGVIDARVHLVQSKRDLAGRPTASAKASVFVEYQPTAQGLLPIQNAEVQKIVANSVGDLAVEEVAVVQKPASIAAPGVQHLDDLKLVSVGPLVIEESGLGTLKLVIITVVLLIAGLGGMIFWQGKLIGDLRMELTAARTDLVSLDNDLLGDELEPEAV